MLCEVILHGKTLGALGPLEYWEMVVEGEKRDWLREGKGMIRGEIIDFIIRC